MGLAGPTQPRVSRETRLLLATIFISLAALWALARIRFPERPVTTNPVPPLLTQLNVPAGFEDLASAVSSLDARVLPSLAQVGSSMSLRVRDNVGALLLAQPQETAQEFTVIARDPASGLTLVTIPGAPAPPLIAADIGRPERPRYMIASDVSPGGPSLRPVFIGRFHPVSTPAWPGEIWALPARTAVSPGDFLFTTDAALVGLVIAHGGARAVVPGATVLRAVDDLFANRGKTNGWLGVEVQTLPPAVAVPAGGVSGVMVAFVHPEGPAAGKLFVMDVIETLDGHAVASPAAWLVGVSRRVPGTTVVVRVRRGAEVHEVSLTSSARLAQEPPLAALGLTLRTLRRTGAEVTQVDDGSLAARAGLRAGDVITGIGDVRAPTAAQVTSAFESAPVDSVLLVAITRGNLHRVLALEKK